MAEAAARVLFGQLLGAAADAAADAAVDPVVGAPAAPHRHLDDSALMVPWPGFDEPGLDQAVREKILQRVRKSIAAAKRTACVRRYCLLKKAAAAADAAAAATEAQNARRPPAEAVATFVATVKKASQELLDQALLKKTLPVVTGLVVLAVAASFTVLVPAKPFVDNTNNGTTNNTFFDATATCAGLASKRDQYRVALKAATESFNVMVIGMSGLGKSTFQTDLFRMLDPSWKQQALLAIETSGQAASDVCDEISHNLRDEKMAARGGDDLRASELYTERQEKTEELAKAMASFELAVGEYRRESEEMGVLARKIEDIELEQVALRAKRDFDASRGKQLELDELRGKLKMKMMRWSSEASAGGELPQTLQVQVKKILNMPLELGVSASTTRLDVAVIDTPGYSDVVVGTQAAFTAVLEEVERRLQIHLEPDYDLRRKKDRSELIHACVFFLPPHRMMEDDFRMMEKLHHICPLVPVLAKADTMTVEETLKYKDDVRKMLKQRGILTAKLFPKTWHEIQELHAAPGFSPTYRLPLAVMASNAADQEGNSHRGYPWGVAKPNDPQHSELPALRELLLREWRSLRDEAIDKADAEARRRTDESWKREQREKKERELLIEREKIDAAACPLRLNETTSRLEYADHQLHSTATALLSARGELEKLKQELEKIKQLKKATEDLLAEKKRKCWC